MPVAEFHDADSLARQDDLAHIGPDFLGEEFDFDEALRRIRARRRQEIADVLLNQRVVAGIGNEYKNEVLFVARINPFARVRRSHATSSSTRILRTARKLMLPTSRSAPPARITTFSLDPSAAAVRLRPRRQALPPLRNADPLREAGRERAGDVLVRGAGRAGRGAAVPSVSRLRLQSRPWIILPHDLTSQEIRVLQEFRRLNAETMTAGADQGHQASAGGGEQPAAALVGKGYLTADARRLRPDRRKRKDFPGHRRPADVRGSGLSRRIEDTEPEAEGV